VTLYLWRCPGCGALYDKPYTQDEVEPRFRPTCRHPICQYRDLDFIGVAEL
jgi:hypothetical protein